MSLKAIDRKIGTFSTNKAKLQDLGHEIAMMIFDHAFAHADCTRALTLAQEMPKSWKAQLEEWFKTFTPIVVVTKNDKVGLSPAYLKLKKEKPEEALKMWDRIGAEATPFFKLNEPDTQAQVYDFAALVKMVEGLSKRIETQVEKNHVKAEDIESAKAIARTLSGLRFSRVKQDNKEPAKEDAAVVGDAALKAVA